MNAKQYLEELYDIVQIHLQYKDKHEKYDYISYSKQLFRNSQFNSNFTTKLKLSSSQKDLMEHLACIFQQLDPSITWDRIQIYIFRSYTKEPIPLSFPILDEEKLRSRHKKMHNNQSLYQIIGMSNYLYYDVLPFSLNEINNKNIVYVTFIQSWYIDYNNQRKLQMHRVVSNNAILAEYSDLIKDDLLRVVENEDRITDLLGNQVPKFQFYLVHFKYKNFIKFLNDNSKLNEIATNSSFVLYVRVVTPIEELWENDENIMRVHIFRFFKDSDGFGEPLYVFVKKQDSCEDVYTKVMKSANIDLKVKILVVSKDKNGVIAELQKNKVLEPTLDIYLDLYAGKDLAIEFPKIKSNGDMKLAIV